MPESIKRLSEEEYYGHPLDSEALAWRVRVAVHEIPRAFRYDEGGYSSIKVQDLCNMYNAAALDASSAARVEIVTHLNMLFISAYIDVDKIRTVPATTSQEQSKLVFRAMQEVFRSHAALLALEHG